jgi:hypothetical protein
MKVEEGKLGQTVRVRANDYKGEVVGVDSTDGMIQVRIAQSCDWYDAEKLELVTQITVKSKSPGDGFAELFRKVRCKATGKIGKLVRVNRECKWHKVEWDDDGRLKDMRFENLEYFDTINISNKKMLLIC